MSNSNGLAPIRVNVTPGRRVIHIRKAHDKQGADVEIRTLWRLVGLAWDTRTLNERVILAAEDGPDRGGLYLFSLGELGDPAHFVDVDPPQRDAEAVEVPQERVAGHVSTGSGRVA